MPRTCAPPTRRDARWLAALLTALLCLGTPERAAGQTFSKFQLLMARITLEGLATYRATELDATIALDTLNQRAKITVRMSIEVTATKTDTIWFALSSNATGLSARFAGQTRNLPASAVSMRQLNARGWRLEVGPLVKGTKRVLEVSYVLYSLPCARYRGQSPQICPDLVALIGTEAYTPVMWRSFPKMRATVIAPDETWRFVGPGSLSWRRGRKQRFVSDGIAFTSLVGYPNGVVGRARVGGAKLPVRIVGPPAKRAVVQQIQSRIPLLVEAIEALLGPFPRSHVSLGLIVRPRGQTSFFMGSHAVLSEQLVRQIERGGSWKPWRTVVHELIHAYIGTRVMGDPLGSGGMIVQEGLTEYLAGLVIARARLAPDDDVRAAWVKECFWYEAGSGSLNLDDINLFSWRRGLVYCRAPRIFDYVAQLIGPAAFLKRVEALRARFDSRMIGGEALLEALVPKAHRRFVERLLHGAVVPQATIESVSWKAGTLEVVLASNVSDRGIPSKLLLLPASEAPKRNANRPARLWKATPHAVVVKGPRMRIRLPARERPFAIWLLFPLNRSLTKRTQLTL